MGGVERCRGICVYGISFQIELFPDTGNLFIARWADAVGADVASYYISVTSYQTCSTYRTRCVPGIGSMYVAKIDIF